MRLTVAVAIEGCVDAGVVRVCCWELSGLSTLDKLKGCM